MTVILRIAVSIQSKCVSRRLLSMTVVVMGPSCNVPVSNYKREKTIFRDCVLHTTFRNKLSAENIARPRSSAQYQGVWNITPTRMPHYPDCLARGLTKRRFRLTGLTIRFCCSWTNRPDGRGNANGKRQRWTGNITNGRSVCHEREIATLLVDISLLVSRCAKFAIN